MFLEAIMAGITDAEQLHAIDQVNQGSMGLVKDNSIPVRDTDGDLIEIGERYLLDDQLVRIEKAKFGSGNFLDTYYWVWYIKAETLETSRVTIEASYNQGITKGAQYNSKFKKVKQ